MSKIARVQMPDGRIARLEVPDGTTPEQVESFVFNGMKDAPAKPERSFADSLVRQVGLTARAGGPVAAGAAAGAAMGAPIGGVGAIPGAMAGAGAMTILQLVDKIGGTNYIEKAMDLMGLPKPENATERVAGDVAGAMASQAGTIKGAELLNKAASPVTRKIGEILTSRPASQLVGAAGASGAAGATREAGGGPVAQTVAGLVGGVAAPVAADVAWQGTKAIGRGLAAAVKPMTQSGREEIVGNTMRRLATDPDAAVQNMGAAGEIVPGSAPTTAQASRDPGLLTAERAVRSGTAGGQFAERAAQQNQARNILLNSMAKDETALQAAKGERLGQASPLYEKSFSEVVKPPEALVELSKRPAFTEAVKRAQNIAAEQGIDLGDPTNNMRGLHYVKMAMDDIIESAGRDSSIGRTQRRAIIDTQEKLLGIMDDLSPVYKGARETFKKLSAPVNQMETLQDIRSRVTNAGTDPRTGEHFLSQAKFFNAVTKNEAELAKTLTPDQMGSLRRIAQDLDRGALSETAGRAAGSNTYQNLSTAYVLGRALGGQTAESPVMQNLMRPIAWLNKLNEPALQELLTDAMLNPGTARALMGKPSPRAIESVSLELMERARALGIGGAQGLATQGTQRGTQRQSTAPEAQAAGGQ